jgi:hypothetical protein
LPEQSSSSTGIEKLRWFFESARKLTASGGIDQVLAALLETTLEITQTERGYVFLQNASAKMEPQRTSGSHPSECGRSLGASILSLLGSLLSTLPTAARSIHARCPGDANRDPSNWLH